MRAVYSAAILGASAVLASPAHHHQLAARVNVDTQPTIVQLFEWNWASVQAECPTLGQLGYKYVQVSPPAEHITGGQWWTSYQRVSGQLTSKRGNRAQFGAMVSACQAAGVGVLVDVILNHMTAGSGTGVGGTSYSQYTYTGLYSGFDFHYCDTPDRSIDNWGNKTQIQFCQLSGLADLKSESEYVRSTLVNHLNDLLSFPGVSGFRIDAAKHMPIADLQNITRRLTRNPYITSEVVGTGPPIPPSDYVTLGAVILSDSYAVLQTGFKNGDLTKLNGWETREGVHTGSANVFVATQDSERGNVGGSLVPSQTAWYTMANVFMLAYPFGTPTVLSSYQFKSVDDGAPAGGAGKCSGTAGANGFWCQHRWTGIANMVKFRTAAGAAALDHYQLGSKNQIAFGRQNVGFVAINNDRSAWNAKLATSLPAGTYCDIVGGAKSGSACTHAKATVSGGKIQITVPAGTAVAFYTGAKL